MANCFDYLKWRGDLNFNAAPLNDVDNWILCKVGMPDYSGIIPEDGYIPLGQAIRKYFDEKGDGLGILIGRNTLDFLALLPESERFKNLMVGDYRQVFNDDETEQFSALTIMLHDGRRYVSFRGTDDTILGWKENFHMSFSATLTSQMDAVRYLSEQCKKHSGPIIVGGHSKGGNLAVYAATYVNPKEQDQITDIYNNDGPGYLDELQKLSIYKRIKPKIHTIMSNHAVVGMLLNYEKDGVQITKSPYTGVKAHDGFNWEVEGNHFVETDNYSIDAIAFRDALNEVIADIPYEDRVALVDALFDALQSTGVKTATEFAESEWKDLWAIFKKMKNVPGISDFVVSFAKSFTKKSASKAYRKLID